VEVGGGLVEVEVVVGGGGGGGLVEVVG